MMQDDLAAIFGRGEKQLIHHARAAAVQCGFRVFLVGGIVRDRLLGREGQDWDFLVSGDTKPFLLALRLELSRLLGREISAKLVEFSKYRTAKMLFFEEPKTLGTSSEVPLPSRIDVSAFRLEHYPSSGHPPEVLPGSLLDDMMRRDFSVNALALELLDDCSGVAFSEQASHCELIDLVSGMPDLSGRCLRILHDKSFLDDPARLIRGLRFKHRLGFTFDKMTEELFHEAIDQRVLLNLAAVRLFDEFSKLIDEDSCFDILHDMTEGGLTEQILPGLSVLAEEEFQSFYDEVLNGLTTHQVSISKTESRLLAIMLIVANDRREECMFRFGLRRGFKKLVREFASIVGR